MSPGKGRAGTSSVSSVPPGSLALLTLDETESSGQAADSTWGTNGDKRGSGVAEWTVPKVKIEQVCVSGVTWRAWPSDIIEGFVTRSVKVDVVPPCRGRIGARLNISLRT